VTSLKDLEVKTRDHFDCVQSRSLYNFREPKSFVMQRKKERKKNVVLEKKFVVAYPVDKMAKKRLFLLTNLLTKFY